MDTVQSAWITDRAVERSFKLRPTHFSTETPARVAFKSTPSTGNKGGKEFERGAEWARGGPEGLVRPGMEWIGVDA